MANTDKNIVITPNIGQTADPKVAYSGANASVGAQTITLYVYPADSGTLSWEGSAGQLLSVTNTLSGTIFAVNDVSGIPSITVQDTGQVTLAPYTGNLIIGSTTDANTAKVQITGTVSATGNITAGNLSGTNIVGTLVTAAQTNITSVGTLTGLTVNNYVTSSGYIFDPWNLGSTNIAVVGGGSAASGRTLLGWNRSSGGGEFNIIVNRNGGSTGGVRFYEWANTQTNTTTEIFAVTGAGAVTTPSTVSAAGNVTGGNIITAGQVVATGNLSVGNIVNSNANGVGNIGSSTRYFNTVFAKATSAQYADLAEMYSADDSYPPGTVLIFGGTHEVTASSITHDPRTAGVVSTNPSYLMNSELTGNNTVALALTGRVPCWVQGPVAKGDRLVNVDTGIAGRLDPGKYEPGCVIGKSLESIKDDSLHLIEVAIGRY